MLIHRPVYQILGGFSFYPHDEERRRLNFFALPLFLPFDHIHLSWGWSIPRRESGSQYVHVAGSVDEMAMTINVLRSEGLRDLLPILSLDGFADFVSRRREWGALWNPTMEIEAYGAMAASAALQGNAQLAAHNIDEMETFARVSSSLPIPERDANTWEVQLSRQAPSLARGDLDSTMALLRSWHSNTVAQLGIEDLLAASGPS